MLLQLDSEGSIGIYGFILIAKNADGTAVVKQVDGHETLSLFAKSLLGSFGSSTGPTPESVARQGSESAADSNKTKVGRDFIRGVTEVLLPNRVAIVAEVEEQWPTVVDSDMESIGGIVFRWTMSEVQQAAEM